MGGLREGQVLEGVGRAAGTVGFVDGAGVDRDVDAAHGAGRLLGDHARPVGERGDLGV